MPPLPLPLPNAWGVSTILDLFSSRPAPVRLDAPTTTFSSRTGTFPNPVYTESHELTTFPWEGSELPTSLGAPAARIPSVPARRVSPVSSTPPAATDAADIAAAAAAAAQASPPADLSAPRTSVIAPAPDPASTISSSPARSWASSSTLISDGVLAPASAAAPLSLPKDIPTPAARVPLLVSFVEDRPPQLAGLDLGPVFEVPVWPRTPEPPLYTGPQLPSLDFGPKFEINNWPVASGTGFIGR